MRSLEFLTIHRSISGSSGFMGSVLKNAQSSYGIQAAQITEKIVGREIVAGCWDDSHAAFLLSGDCGLYFAAIEQRVSFCLIAASLFKAFEIELTTDPSPVLLSRKNKKGETITCEMDRRDIFSRMLHQQVRRIVVDEFGTYIHMQEQRRYLAFHAQFLSSGEPFLEWFEDAD